MSEATNPGFQKRITTTFEWILALPSVLLNYTVIGSFFSILPYLGITRHLRETQQLTHTNYRRSYLLGFFAFLVYALFFIYYHYLYQFIATFGDYILLTADVLIWSILSLTGSWAIGHSLLAMKNEQ